MSNEILSREAAALIKLGEVVGQLGESENLLREARYQCHKLRRDRLAITRAYKDVSHMLDEAIKALREIAKMDTSQEASPQQCGAVLIAMNALEKIK